MGVSSKLWIDSIDDKIFIKQGDYLDDLIFIHYLIANEKSCTLNGLLQIIEKKIHNLCYMIYNKAYPLQIITKAWLCRKYSPMLFLFAENENEAKLCN